MYPFFFHYYSPYLGNVYIADYSNHRVRKVTVSTGIITTIAGNGGTGSYSGDGEAATSAGLYQPIGLAVDSSGSSTYSFSYSLRFVTDCPFL